MRKLHIAIALSTLAFLVAGFAFGDQTRDQMILEAQSLKEEIADRLTIERLGEKAKVELDPDYEGTKTQELIERLLQVNTHINGEDGRTNTGSIPIPSSLEVPDQVPGPLRMLGDIPLTPDVARNIRGVAAIVPRSLMDHVGNVWSPKSIVTYHDVKNVCIDKVRFALEPVLAGCTAFLVTPTMVATAGHCVEAVQAKNLLFIFDFSADDKTHIAKEEFPDTDVVAGKVVVDWGVEPSDWALIELEREVADRDPLVVDWDHPVAVDDEVYMIGHSAGLPLKIGRAKIIRTASRSFVSDVDSLGGNSGSPIISFTTNNVVGILARSREGYVDIGGCNILESCPSSLFTDCDGEGCTKITEIPRWREAATPSTMP